VGLKRGLQFAEAGQFHRRGYVGWPGTGAPAESACGSSNLKATTSKPVCWAARVHMAMVAFRSLWEEA
jgi:hypothetical protein